MLQKLTYFLLISITLQNVIHYHYYNQSPSSHMSRLAKRGLAGCDDCRQNERCVFGTCQPKSSDDAAYQGPDAWRRLKRRSFN